jgi:FAD-linked oxidoreductase
MTEWRNWSGSVRATPGEIVRPADEAALQIAVSAARKVRVVGAGHSFMPLCETDGVLLRLEDMAGQLTVADDRKTVWAPAGWSLRRLTADLWEQGLSLPNQGDVNPQALAGAIATGTHGTGAELGSLATIARAFRLVAADGTIVECSPTQRPDLFEAQRLSLGLFGVATRIQIDVLPAYSLEERVYKLPLAQVVATFDKLAATHRHAEFFVFPYSDDVIVKTLHPTDQTGDPREPSPHEDAIFQILCDAGRTAQFLIPRMQRFMTRAAGEGRRVGPAYRIFPSERSVKFEEMEYELPRANGLPAIQEAIAWIRKDKLPVAFPFEFRLTAGDDIWMSPFNRGPGASISMHQYARMPWRKLFAEGEKIFRAAGGRPHWAKRHTLTRDEVTSLYPMAERFREVRRAADPEGKFLNPHLADLFG